MRQSPDSAGGIPMLAEHASADGPRITHVKGTLLSHAIENLRIAGVYDEYVTVLPEVHAKALAGAIALTWIPVEHVVAHYDACDQLAISREHFEEIGRRNAKRVAETFLGFTLRRVRDLGIETFKQSASKFGALHDRIFRGGGCAVLDVGRKDLIFEIVGCPFARSRSFRVGFEAYTAALVAAFVKVGYVKLVRPRGNRLDAVALAVSWV